MMDVDDPPPLALELTAGAAGAIANDEYHYGLPRVAGTGPGEGLSDALLDAGERVVMQVLGLARLKYSVGIYNDIRTSRENFVSGEGTSYAEDAKYWVEDTPYRLLLSDGSRAVAGKFFDEMADPAKESGKIHRRIHQLVVGGQLREGSIVSFVPNCHRASGKGIATMFRMEVEGWQEIIGAPQPMHDGASAYSPYDVHQCTVPVPSAGISHPEPTPISLYARFLAKTIQDIYGHCTISGSAALAEYLHSLPGCDHCYGVHYSDFIRGIRRAGSFNNDVDLFVPESSGDLTDFYASGVKKEERTRGGFDKGGLESSILPALFKRYGIHHSPVTDTSIKLSRLGSEDSLHPFESLESEDRGVTQATTMDYGWMKIFVGLKRKLEFNLLSPTGELLTPKPIQILVVDAYPETRSQTWGELITSGFDADVIKCATEVGEDHALKPVTFHDDHALENVRNGRFEYTMRPCHSFPQMMKRLLKYRHRGFTLSKFSFDERVSREWREYILHEFRLEYAQRWWKEFVENGGSSVDDNDLPTIARKHILPYLGRFEGDDLSDRDVFPRLMDEPEIPPSEENKKRHQAIIRGLLRRNILEELDRTGFRDPGNNKIAPFMLVGTWRSIDREDDGVDMSSFWESIIKRYPMLDDSEE